MSINEGESFTAIQKNIASNNWIANLENKMQIKLFILLELWFN